MEPFETFEHAGCTIELHNDHEPISPADWDNLGTLVAFDSLWREYRFAERQSGSTEDDARERNILVRYLRLCYGEIAVPFQFHEERGSACLYACDEDNANGFIYTTHKRVNELCSEDAKYHTVEWIEQALRAELATWNHYVAGEVVGYVVRYGGEIVDSCWGFYPDDKTRENPDGLNYVRLCAKDAAEFEQAERVRAANSDIATR